MGIGTILLIILVLLLIGVLPTWPYSAGWGYYPGGGVGLVLRVPSRRGVCRLRVGPVLVGRR